MNKEQMGVDPKIKKEINAEGYDDDGGYLIVGTPKERDLAKQRIESGGITKDLGTYIKLHKEIGLLFNEINDEELKQEILKSKQNFSVSCRERVRGLPEEPFLFHLKYIDKDGNLATVEIRLDKVADLKDLNIESYIPEVTKRVEEELKKLGFIDGWKKFKNPQELKTDSEEHKAYLQYILMWQKIDEVKKECQEKLEQEAKNRTIKEFDF